MPCDHNLKVQRDVKPRLTWGLCRRTRHTSIVTRGMLHKIRKVVVGVSGGVDSAVAALLLKQKGFDVHAVFMRNWDAADEGAQCSADADYADARAVCERLRVPLHQVDFVKPYWNHVFADVLREYEGGRTPNPDILCNRHIKFDEFMRHALGRLGADAVATGHYASTSFGPFLQQYRADEKVRLLRARDPLKDQTFFLGQVHERWLRRVMFPLGDMLKAEVRETARSHGLARLAAKKESMGMCFVGARDFPSFIAQYLEDRPGDFVDLDTNERVGRHRGLHQWTVGQRSRLQQYNRRAYVARKDPTTNTLYVAEGWRHPALYSDLFFTAPPHWIHSEPAELAAGGALHCQFKFQHVEQLRDCSLCVGGGGGLVVNLGTAVRALTPGQFAVFYRGSECLGSAPITSAGPHRLFLTRYRREPVGCRAAADDCS